MQSLRIAGLMASSFLLCACSLASSLTHSVTDTVGSIGSTVGIGGGPPAPPTTGVAVGDEPFAVQAAIAQLAQGGSAADAATTMFFALTVTYPTSAGLGGGGVCLVHDAKTGTVQEFDFLAREAAGGGAYAVPGAVKGFADLQAAYGVLPWQRDVAPAEGLANTGFPISQALSQRLLVAQGIVRLDAALAREFLDESGQVKSAGTTVTNSELAQTLTAIRAQGADGFYSGPIASAIVAYSAAQGGAITASELSGYNDTRRAARNMTLADETVYLPTPATGAGAFAGAVFDNLATGGSVAADEGAIAGATQRALATFHVDIASLPKDMGSTGFAVVDAQGQAVSCAVTMNGPFGSGRSVTGSGIVLARAPASAPEGLAGAFLTPVMAIDGAAVTLAGAGAGGPNGTAAIAYALLQAARTSELLGPGDIRTTGAAPYETVNAVNCRSLACVALGDPAANGMGAAAGAEPPTP